MKTNQIIKRPMGVFVVEQRTRDGFFFATGLLKQWNKTVGNQEIILNTHLGGVFKKKDFSDWMKAQITRCDLVENQDFDVFPQKVENPKGGRPSTE